MHTNCSIKEFHFKFSLLIRKIKWVCSPPLQAERWIVFPVVHPKLAEIHSLVIHWIKCRGVIYMKPNCYNWIAQRLICQLLDLKDSQEPKISTALVFAFQELADATENFSPECLMGVGSYGKIYKGKLKGTGQVVTIEHLDRNGSRGNREFLCEVLTLNLLHHPNLMDLVGYCAEGDEKLLVREHLPLGSLDQHLHDNDSKEKPLNWCMRMKIALGIARGLEYLHDKANPPVIYRNLKPYNIFLDNDFNAKLSDFGLSKLGPTGDKKHVSTRVMGTYGYIAPEYERTGQLSVKADVYSFGVVLLELITGRKAIVTRLAEEQNLVSWAQNILKDPKRLRELADPSLQGDFPALGFEQAVAVATKCVQEQATARPMMSDVVNAITYFSTDQSYNVSSSEPLAPVYHRRI